MLVRNKPPDITALPVKKHKVELVGVAIRGVVDTPRADNILYDAVLTHVPPGPGMS